MDINWDSEGLRPLNALFVQDPLWESVSQIDKGTGKLRLKSIEDHYSTIEPLFLSKAVPVETLILWNTARNLYVYSWFIWRFMPVAELYGYAALENALRQRCAKEDSFPQAKNKKRPSYQLAPLLKHAFNKGWIDVESLESYKYMQEARTRSLKRAMKFMGDEKSAEAWVADLDPTKYRKQLEISLPFTRNEIAHGSSPLSPTVDSSLILCHDLIQHLYPCK
jgi:hypothetical protein